MENRYNISLLIGLALTFIILFSHSARAETQFDVEVPLRTPGTPVIRDIDLFIDLPVPETGDVTFEIRRTSSGIPESNSFTLRPEPGLRTETMFYQDDEGGLVDEREDKVTIESHSITGAPDTIRFKVLMELETNWYVDEDYDFCAERQNIKETWHIETHTDGALPITGVCINSYDYDKGATINCNRMLVQPTDMPATIVSSSPIPTITPCADKRPAVDVVLVLDRSGSMNRPVTDADVNKIDALNTALNNFVQLWNQVAHDDDNVGVVLFNHEANDWVLHSDLNPDLNPGLNKLTDVATIIADNTISAGGATSIGDGLELAANHLVSGGNPRKVILLMSDGRQNSDRWVAVVPDNGDFVPADADGDDSTDDSVVVTHLRDGTGYTALPGIEDLNIWSVSIGADTDIESAIFEELADTGIGFYLHSEADADEELNLFFLELLQNFLRFNTIETTRLVNDTIPIVQLLTADIGTTQLDVATTSTAKTISFSLMWDKTKDAQFSMQITPPKGDIIASNDGTGRIQQGLGFMRFTTALPLDDPYPKGSQIGDWKVRINVRGRGLGKKFPYQFYALADDDIVKAEFTIDNRDYVTGDAILLQAKLIEFRQALTDRDGKLKAFANLIKPEEGIGNVLAENSVKSADTLPDDIRTPTQQKLDALLAENPDLLQYGSETIPLFDDGLAAHGDAVANDGVFSNFYQDTDKQGHYNFLFNVEGATHSSGPISRQQIETVYVRLQPDPDRTEISTDLIGSGPDRQLKVSMTPRDQFGNKFGPGYANHFLIAPINGKQLKFQDKNLDGVYEFTIPVGADETLPLLDVRYVKPFINVTDEMYPDRVPQSLTESFIQQENKKSSVSLHLGANFPHGGFNSNFDGDIGYAIDYEYRWGNKNSLLLFLGQNRFDNPVADLDVTNFSINAKHYFGMPAIRSWRYFINGGLGYYKADPGGNDAGINIGAGTQYPIDNNYGLEASYNYHLISSSPTINFSTLQLGVYYRF